MLDSDSALLPAFTMSPDSALHVMSPGLGVVCDWEDVGDLGGGGSLGDCGELWLTKSHSSALGLGACSTVVDGMIILFGRLSAM